ncbi:hypothetical protein SELMODRAFT_411913 [Selaginella moellendorffii]|uniref:Uncharacterized protein n=1 Tax=Selaginella moellendorffii TaxID=88036 RepID=D8RJF3_SELML|nr:hypothetical protein SELMODRAFT_411913 [Selaginella moellendorffii]
MEFALSNTSMRGHYEPQGGTYCQSALPQPQEVLQTTSQEIGGEFPQEVFKQGGGATCWGQAQDVGGASVSSEVFAQGGGDMQATWQAQDFADIFIDVEVFAKFMEGQNPRHSVSPKRGFSVLGQVRSVSRDEIRQEALHDPFLEVYRSEKRPLSPRSLTHSPSKELTFIAISKYTAPDGSDDLRSLGRSVTTLQERVEVQAKELEAQAAILEQQSREIKELQPMKEWFQKQNMELYWSKVGSPRGVAAFEILAEVRSMLSRVMHNHISSVIETIQSEGSGDSSEQAVVCEENAAASSARRGSKRERREHADAYRQLFGKGPFRNKKFKHGTYEDLLMHVVAKESANEAVDPALTDALEAAEAEFYLEASEAGYDMQDVQYIRSKMAKFLTCERKKRNEACHPLGMKSRQVKEEIVDDIERACDSKDLGDLNEISSFIKFGCLLFRRHNHL